MKRDETEVKKKSFSVESRSFHPLIIRTDNSFCVYLPEWKLSGVGASLEEAYQQFEQNYKTVTANASEFGLSALTPESYPVLKRGEVLQQLMLFFAKMASGVFILIFLLVLLLPNITAALRNNLKQIMPTEIVPIEFKDPRYWALQFPAQMNARLDRLSPAEEETIRHEWSRLFGRTLPIVSTLTCTPQVR